MGVDAACDFMVIGWKCKYARKISLRERLLLQSNASSARSTFYEHNSIDFLWVFRFFCARKTRQNAIWLVQVLKIACTFEFHSLKSWNLICSFWRLTHSLHISIQFISIWSFEYCVHISHDVYHLTERNQSIIYINTYTTHTHTYARNAYICRWIWNERFINMVRIGSLSISYLPQDMVTSTLLLCAPKVNAYCINLQFVFQCHVSPLFASNRNLIFLIIKFLMHFYEIRFTYKFECILTYFIEHLLFNRSFYLTEKIFFSPIASFVFYTL